MIAGRLFGVFFVEDAIEGVGGEKIKIRQRRRKLAHCVTHIVGCEPWLGAFSEGAAVALAPDFRDMRTVFAPTCPLLCT